MHDRGEGVGEIVGVGSGSGVLGVLLSKSRLDIVQKSEWNSSADRLR